MVFKITSVSDILSRDTNVDKNDVCYVSVKLTFPTQDCVQILGRDFDTIHNSLISMFMDFEQLNGLLTVELFDSEYQSLLKVDTLLTLNLLILSVKCRLYLFNYDYFKIFNHPLILASLEMNDVVSSEYISF